MKGLYIHQHHEHTDSSSDLTLLARNGNIEITTQEILESAVAWLAPAEQEDAFEFYYLISGKMEIVEDNDVTVLLPGDSITLTRLTKDVMLRCIERARMLCVTNIPSFSVSNNTYWQNLLMEQLTRIDEKDHYTQAHSKRVMQYSKQLFDALRAHCGDISLDDFVVGCLFHDIGKINIPSAILSKPERLTDDEYTLMKTHSTESGGLLKPLFGDKVATLAASHHERLDGSGYPFGLTEKDIDFPTRILMVADAFDAMTSNRTYRKADSLEKAARELVSLPEKFDSVVTETLLKLVLDGSMEKRT